MVKLEPYKGPRTRYRCPQCHKEKKFVRYVDGHGNHIAHDVGRCNREINCGYHKTPRQHYAQHGRPDIVAQPAPPPPPQRVGRLPQNILEAMHKNPTAWQATNFAQALQAVYHWSLEDVAQTVARYRWGASKQWEGAVAFPLIDSNGSLREIKVMQYSSETARRDKKKLKHMAKVLTGDSEARFPKCFFGEHLLKQHPAAPVGIVESEKTAIIASHYLPKYIWLATGGSQMIKTLQREGRFNQLKGRKVIAFPDLGATDSWTEWSKMLPISINVSKSLENKATGEQRREGFDLADYLKPQETPEAAPVHIPPAPPERPTEAPQAPQLPTIKDPHKLAAQVAPTCDSWPRETIYTEIARAVGCSYQEAPDYFHALIEAEAIEPNLVGYHLAGSSPF